MGIALDSPGNLSERRFLNLPASNAGGANAKALACAVDQCMHSLKVQIPATFGDVMGMADPMPKLWSPAANFTGSCHKYTPALSGCRAQVLLYQAGVSERNNRSFHCHSLDTISIAEHSGPLLGSIGLFHP